MREHGEATIPMKDYHLTWASLWNKGWGFAQTNLPSQSRSSLGLKFAAVHTNGVRGELDKGASLCSSAQSLFWGQRGPCVFGFFFFFFISEKAACLQGHILSHLWTEHGKNTLSNSANLFSSQKSVYKHVKCKHNIFRENKDKSITNFGDSSENGVIVIQSGNLMSSAEDEGMGYFI